MSEKKNTSEPNEEKNKNEGQGAATAVLENPRDWQDEDEVTVLYGWGRVHPNSRQFVDKTLFEGGVARNVPYEVAKHWASGTRPDGKRDQVYGKVKVHILPNDAKEADFCRVTGITPMPVDQFAAMLVGVDLDALITQLGVAKVKALIDGLEQRLPENARR